MAFSINREHISRAGIVASAESIPFLPEPRIYTQEIPGRDGYLNFTSFNNLNRATYRPREWRFLCSIEPFVGESMNAAVQRIAGILVSGTQVQLEVDACPGLWWDATITNRFDLVNVARNLRQFNVYFLSQPFGYTWAEGTEVPYLWAGRRFEA
jgi:phage-related protein